MESLPALRHGLRALAVAGVFVGLALVAGLDGVRRGVKGAPAPATPEGNDRLRKVIDQNQRAIDRIRELMKEHVELLALQNRVTRDSGRAEEHGEWLAKIVEELTARNKKIRDDLGLRPGIPIPKPNDP